MLPGEFTAVHQAQSREQFRQEFERFTRQLGFETFTALTMVERGVGPSDVAMVDNAPATYVDSYVDISDGRRDPVLRHCRQASVPIIWNRETYTDQGAGDLWEHQARHGYRTGIAMALHLPNGRHFMMGVDRKRDLPTEPLELQRMVADLQLFAVHAIDAAMRVLIPPSSDGEVPKLTPREVEALEWTMRGKTAWEVGSLMGITERTAVSHLNNATHKLGCVGKHQAVLKALRLRLIDE